MRTKNLRYTTIIPSHLYVRREADRQLREVLDDMGGPGYVLVARQMGKTNLLLNAKSELESVDRIFVYIDLSNPFSTVTEYFRNIIDTAIDTHREVFGHLDVGIKQNRTQQQLLAHKEHDIELRTLLTQVKEKLVIILDEIDALTNTEFSDQVFAQIRSTYFAGRTNYREFCKLTYILSGVAEPTEIIKNPKMSPFNIGEKIYLDDFTMEEFLEFLAKAKLPMDEATSDRIFYWASGNPRITWEICSALEDVLIAGQQLTSEQVDKVVDKLYLTHFDRPPVDHIRDIVKNDKEIRNAITEIKYGKGGETSHVVRTRMYLAGIVKHSPTGSIDIKNNIIRRALSEQWLIDVEKKLSGLLTVAQERFSQHRYQEAIDIAEDYLASSNPNKDDANLVYLLIGSANYRLGRYHQAIEALGKCEFDRRKSRSYFRETKISIGLCLLFLGNHPSALQIFDDLIESSGDLRDKHYYQAAFSRASLVKDPLVDGAREYEQLLQSINRDEAQLDDSFVAETKIGSHYNLALAYQRQRDIVKFNEHLKFAIELSLTAMPRFAPFLIAELCSAETDSEKRKLILEQACTVIVEKGLTPAVHSMPAAGSSLEFREATILRLLVLLYSEDMHETLARLIGAAEKMNLQWKSPAQLYLQLGITASSLGLSTVSGSILLDLCNKKIDANIDEPTLLSAYRFLLRIREFEESEGLKHFWSYFDLFRRLSRPDQVDQLDLGVVANAVTVLIRAKRFSDIDQIMTAIGKYREHLAAKDADASFVLFDYFALLTFSQRRDSLQEYLLAERIINLFEKVKRSQKEIVLPAIADENQTAILRAIESHAHERYFYLRSHPTVTRLFPMPPKHGRNSIVSVEYQDGTVRANVKYKKIEQDLIRGLCKIR